MNQSNEYVGAVYFRAATMRRGGSPTERRLLCKSLEEFQLQLRRLALGGILVRSMVCVVCEGGCDESEQH